MPRPAEDKRDRKKRVPFGVPRMKLKTDQVPGKVRRWINDDVDRLGSAHEGGYEFVEHAQSGSAGSADITIRDGMDSRVSKVVGTKADGSPLRAYLMEIDEDWYKEDQEAKQSRVDKTEEALRRGTDETGTPGRDGRYIPREGIKIERS